MNNEQYSKTISNLINNNVKYYNLQKTIKWRLLELSNEEITGTVCKKTDVLTINTLFVDKCIRENDMESLEYFLLHEIRHIYQNKMISDYKQNKINVDVLLEKWIKEKDNYIPAISQNKELNKNYFYQDIEIDAYAYGYAVMIHKYGIEPNVYIPEYNTEEFFKIVKEFTVEFNCL